MPAPWRGGRQLGALTLAGLGGPARLHVPGDAGGVALGLLREEALHADGEQLVPVDGLAVLGHGVQPVPYAPDASLPGRHNQGYGLVLNPTLNPKTGSGRARCGWLQRGPGGGGGS